MRRERRRNDTPFACTCLPYFLYCVGAFFNATDEKGDDVRNTVMQWLSASVWTIVFVLCGSACQPTCNI